MPPAPVLLPPRVYHLSGLENWPSIQRRGLLSARSLLDAAGLPGPRRARDVKQRTETLFLADGSAVGHQRPMPPEALARCLRGVLPGEWYALLNRQVFFWLDPARLDRFQRAGGPSAQVLLTIDTKKLLSRYGESAYLTPINSGNARRAAATRGPASFVPYHRWREDRWDSEAAALGTRPRPRSHRPVELTIDVPIPDALEMVIEIRHLAPGDTIGELPDARGTKIEKESETAGRVGRTRRGHEDLSDPARADCPPCLPQRQLGRTHRARAAW